MSDRLRRKDVMALFNLSRQTIDNAISKGELDFKGGWIDRKAAMRWAADRGHEPAGEIVLQKPDGAGLVDDEFLATLSKVYIPPEIIANAESVVDAAKSQIALVAAQEKQVKLMKDVGRLGDLNELQAVMDAIAAAMVNAIKSLDVELAQGAVRRHKVKTAAAKGILQDARDHLLSYIEAVMAELAEKARAFQDAKEAEQKRKGRTK